MRGGIIVFLSVFFLYGCEETTTKCFNCGTFEIVNYSKEAENVDHSSINAIRRTLKLNENSGKDDFVAWQWNKAHPENSETAYMTKVIDVKGNHLLINGDGTWEMKLKMIEYFQLIPQFGATQYEIEREFVEAGHWEYLSSRKERIVFTKEFEKKVKHVLKHLKSSSENNLEQYTISDSKNAIQKRVFELKKQGEKDEFILQTSGKNNFMQIDEELGASYSLMNGNIRITLAMR